MTGQRATSRRSRAEAQAWQTSSSKPWELLGPRRSAGRRASLPGCSQGPAWLQYLAPRSAPRFYKNTQENQGFTALSKLEELLPRAPGCLAGVALPSYLNWNLEGSFLMHVDVESCISVLQVQVSASTACIASLSMHAKARAPQQVTWGHPFSLSLPS